MKRLLVIAACVILTVAASGCRCGPLRSWMCRGYEARCSASCDSGCATYGPGTVYGGGDYADVYAPGAEVIPGPVN